MPDSKLTLSPFQMPRVAEGAPFTVATPKACLSFTCDLGDGPVEVSITGGVGALPVIEDDLPFFLRSLADAADCAFRGVEFELHFS